MSLDPNYKEVSIWVDRTTYNGYMVFDHLGSFVITQDVTKAIAWALDRSKIIGSSESVKVYYIGTVGQYAENPGERFSEPYDWERGARELMG